MPCIKNQYTCPDCGYQETIGLSEGGAIRYECQGCGIWLYIGDWDQCVKRRRNRNHHSEPLSCGCGTTTPPYALLALTAVFVIAIFVIAAVTMAIICVYNYYTTGKI